MSQIIIYKQDSGVVAVVHPVASVVDEIGIESIANNDVPTGKPYLIMDSSLLPATREQRNAWTISDAELISGVGQ